MKLVNKNQPSVRPTFRVVVLVNFEISFFREVFFEMFNKIDFLCQNEKLYWCGVILLFVDLTQQFFVHSCCIGLPIQNLQIIKKYLMHNREQNLRSRVLPLISLLSCGNQLIWNAWIIHMERITFLPIWKLARYITNLTVWIR